MSFLQTAIVFFLLVLVIPVLTNLASDEISIWIPRFLHWYFRRAANKIADPQRREELLREWTAELDCRPGLIWKLWFGMPMVLWGCRAVVRQVDGGCAPSLWVTLAITHYRWSTRHPLLSSVAESVPTLIALSIGFAKNFPSYRAIAGFAVVVLIDFIRIFAKHVAEKHVTVVQLRADVDSWENWLFDVTVGPIFRRVDGAVKLVGRGFRSRVRF